MPEKIQEFIREFMPDVGRVQPHNLLFDAQGHYRDVLFTSNELKACLAAYIGMIEPLISELQTAEKPVQHLHQSGYIEASELTLAYIYRTRKDEDFDALLDYIVEVEADAQVQSLLDVIDPEQKVRSDGIKRISSIRDILKDLRAGHTRP